MNPLIPIERRRRAALAMIVIAILVASLGFSYWRAQLSGDAAYALRFPGDRVRAIPTPAWRGTVYDRNGAVIAGTAAAYSLFIEPGTTDAVRASLDALRAPLGLTDSAEAVLLARHAGRPGSALLLSADLDSAQLSWIDRHRAPLPGVAIEKRPLRRYPAGEAAGHLVGYMGEITERELGDARWTGYTVGEVAGHAGIERQYERVLGGRAGERYVEVDSSGKVVAPLAAEETVAPVPGRDVHLTIDLPLQRFVHSIFPRELGGAVVAMIPSTGEVLALYSNPSFDPDALTNGTAPGPGIRSRDGLVDRAIGAAYPLGSIFKVVTAVTALGEGVVTPPTHMPIPCTGGMTYAGRYLRCWEREGHGSLDLTDAIASSCDVYFYQLGVLVGLNRLAAEGTRLGFSRPTGIDLPDEHAGSFPDGPGWFRRRFGLMPPSDAAMRLAVGRGPGAQTPMRVAQFFAAIAGNGTAPAPHLVRRESAPALPETDLRLSAGALAAVRNALGLATQPTGAASLAHLDGWKVYGMTSATGREASEFRTHSWFAGFAGPPGESARITIVVLLEYHGEGGPPAASIASEIAAFYRDES